MNRLLLLILIPIIVLSVFFFAGKKVFLAGLHEKIIEFDEKTRKFDADRQLLDERIKTLIAQKASGIITKKGLSILRYGQEGGLMKKIYEIASNTNTVIDKFETMATFFIKNRNDENTAMQPIKQGENLPQLDDQGMPVGISQNEDSEWKGFEILPIKISLKGNFSGWGSFFHEADKSLQLFGVRSMQMIFEKSASDKSSIIKGGAILVFPLKEKEIRRQKLGIAEINPETHDSSGE